MKKKFSPPHKQNFTNVFMKNELKDIGGKRKKLPVELKKLIIFLFLNPCHSNKSNYCFIYSLYLESSGKYQIKTGKKKKKKKITF